MSKPNDQNSRTPRRGGSFLRTLASLFIIFLFIIVAATAYFVIRAAKTTEAAIVQPIGDLFQQLVVPATPVILPNAGIIVNQINDLARLETATVDLEKIITAERNTDTFWGTLGETLIFVANGTAVAGIDFAEMEEGDIQVMDPTTVMVHLPEARLFDDLPILNNEDSYVADRDTGFLTRADPNLETEVRQVAEQTIREEALATGVVETANENAREFMRTFLEGLGFEYVIFTEDMPPVPPPYEQPIPKGQVLITPTPESTIDN